MAETNKKRKWKTEKLPCVFTVRATQNERRIIEKKSQAAGLSMSRLLIDSAINSELQTAETAKEEAEELEGIKFQLLKIGINVNQLAVSMHTNSIGTDAHRQLETAADEVKKVLEVVKNKLR